MAHRYAGPLGEDCPPGRLALHARQHAAQRRGARGLPQRRYEVRPPRAAPPSRALQVVVSEGTSKLHIATYSYIDCQDSGAARLRLAPMAEKTATAAFCAPDSGTCVGYRRPGARAGAVCGRPDVEGGSRSARAAWNTSMSGAAESIASENSALSCALTVCCIIRALCWRCQAPQPGQVQDGGAPTRAPRKHGRHCLY